MANGTDFFDEVGSKETAQPNEKPIWTLTADDTSPPNLKKIHTWLLSEMGFLIEENKDRFSNIQRNLAIYKGVQFTSQETRNGRDQGDQIQVQKIVANHTFDLVQNAVGRLVKYKPAVAILPEDDQQLEDRLAAEITKGWIDDLWYRLKYEGQVDPAVKKLAKVMGEAYLDIDWNPDAGPEHPEYQAIKEQVAKGKKVPLKGEDGKPELDDAGKPIMISDPVYIGEVDYRIVLTTDVLVQRVRQFAEAEYMFIRECMAVEKARLRWPEPLQPIKSNGDARVYDFEKMEVRNTNRSEVVVWRFDHRRTKGCPDGLRIYFTVDGIIQIGKIPFSHDELPVERLVDKLLPGELHGVSGIDFVKSLTGAYNNITNMILRNQVMCAHPKWMLPAGAAKLETLGNDITICQFKGPVAPQLVSANPTPSECFEFRKELKEEFQQIYGVFGVSRGEPPAGIKAGVALQFLDEQEQERANEDVLNANEFQRRVAIKTIKVAADKYDETDKRTLRIKSKGDQWKAVIVNPSHLERDFDIRCQNSSALPNSKAARMQTLMDLKKEFPGAVSDEQFLDLIDLAQDKKFISIAAVSVRAAEAENEMLLDPMRNKDSAVPEPREYEDLIIHWRSHARAVREFSYKNMTPPEVQERMEDHILATEMLIEQKAKMNPAFLQKVAASIGAEGYPLFFFPNAVAERSDPPPQLSQLEAPDAGAPPAEGDAAFQDAQAPINADLPGALPEEPAAPPAPPMNPDEVPLDPNAVQ